MIFNQSYYSAMDRGYYMPLGDSSEPVWGDATPADIEEIGLPMNQIGISAAPMQDQLQQLKAKIFQGASKVELGFTGTGKGSMQGGQTTPEMYGFEERIDIRELAKANEVELTTHASPSAGSLAGLGQQGFDEHQRERTLHEVERAIDFAADTTNGGAIVVHANEFPRSIFDRYEGFEAYPEEHDRAVKHLVDERTGSVIPIQRNTVVYEPVYKEYDKDHWIDVYGKPIPKTESDYTKLFNRVPEWNPDGTDFRTRPLTWKDMEQRAEAWNKTHQDEKLSPEQMFFRLQKENQILQAKGASLFYAQRYEDEIRREDQLKKALDYYTELKRRLPPEEHWKIKEATGQFAHFVPPEVEDPVEYLSRTLKQAQDGIRMTHEHSASYDVQARNAADDIKFAKTIEDYGKEKSADTLARAALYALRREEKMTLARNKPLDKPLYVALENLFPEQYGGHPQEVAQMVEDARKKFVEIAKDRYGAEKASELARDHIKATWDTGHANIWRKYFKEKPGESMEDADKRFKKWYVEQAKAWKDKDIIGHVHVSDNFGWEDEHVTPGQGNVPLKEFIKEMKDRVDSGDVDVIVEPAHQDYRAFLGGLKLFGSSIYGLAQGQRDSWVDVERSYFGRSATPYFLYGSSAPDPNTWTLYSQTPLE